MRTVLAAALVLASATAFAGNESAVTISNESSWEIHQFYLSPANQQAWGPDQLRDQVIATEATFTLQGIPCGEYDVRLVDEDGDECVVGAVPLCADNDQWVISDDDLLACQAASDEE